MSGVMTADRIGSAAHYDPQLRTPIRPRLRRGIVVDAAAEQMLITGTPKRQIFRGALATNLLPTMLPRLDGTHGHADLAEALGVSEEVVFKVVSLLWASGVVEEGAPEPVSEGTAAISPAVADYLSRTGDATGANATWEEAAARWLCQRVEVFGDPAVAALLSAEFEAPSPVYLGEGALPSVDATLVVLVQDSSEDDGDVARECWRRGLPLIRFRVVDGTARIGPYVNPDTTPCLDCLLAVEPELSTIDVPTNASDHRLGVALLGRELFALITRSTPSPLPVRWRLVDLAALSGVELTGATRPGCRQCSQWEGAAEPIADASLAIRYEAAVAMPPKAFADNKAHQMHYKPSNLDLQQKFRSWPVAPRQALPAPDLSVLADTVCPERTVLSAHDLAVLLTMSVGVQAITDDRVLRWTACGGNIGSVIAHVVVRACDGVPAGIYAWLPEERALALLDPDPSRIPGSAPASLVFTGDYLKVAQKYNAFALRIVLLDSGCAQTAACEVAGALGIFAQRQQVWDDVAIGEAVDARPDIEPVTAVIDLAPREVALEHLAPNNLGGTR